jgi:hypothetical protein
MIENRRSYAQVREGRRASPHRSCPFPARQGRLIYQGPPSTAVPHFQALGYACPPKMDAADFLVEMNSRDGARYLRSLDELAEAGIDSPPVTADELKAAWEAGDSEGGEARASVLHTQEGPAPGSHAWKPGEAMAYKNGWWTNFRVCAAREWAFVVRDRSYMLARLAQNLVLGLVTGTIYWRIAESAPNDRMGVLYVLIAGIGTKSVSSIPIFFDHRSVYYKQHNSRFFQPSAYAVSAVAGAG